MNIRENLAEEINWYGGVCKYIDWHVAGNEETKNYRREQAKDFIAIFKEFIETMELPVYEPAEISSGLPKLEYRQRQRGQQDLLKAIIDKLEAKDE